MLKATLIYNPLAGPANLAAPIALVADSWRARGWQVTVKPTQFAGHATSLARQAAAAGHQLVFAAGGDGTLGEVVNGLAGTETVMGLLPVGTGNSFAKELMMPRPTRWDKHKLLQAADVLADGVVQSIDLGMTHDEGGKNGRYWLLWAGTGADGFLVDRLEPRPRWSKKLGSFGYGAQALAAASELPPMTAVVDVDGRLFEDRFLVIIISNCRRYAGGELVLSPGASLDDGLFEVWLFRGHGLPTILHYVLKIKLGRHQQDKNVTVVNGRRITIHTNPPMPVQTDGEQAGQTPFICEIKPGALRLLVPKSVPPGLFCRRGQPLEATWADWRPK